MRVNLFTTWSHRTKTIFCSSIFLQFDLNSITNKAKSGYKTDRAVACVIRNIFRRKKCRLWHDAIRVKISYVIEAKKSSFSFSGKFTSACELCWNQNWACKFGRHMAVTTRSRDDSLSKSAAIIDSDSNSPPSIQPAYVITHTRRQNECQFLRMERYQRNMALYNSIPAVGPDNTTLTKKANYRQQLLFTPTARLDNR